MQDLAFHQETEKSAECFEAVVHGSGHQAAVLLMLDKAAQILAGSSLQVFAATVLQESEKQQYRAESAVDRVGTTVAPVKVQQISFYVLQAAEIILRKPTGIPVNQRRYRQLRELRSP